MNTAIFVAAIAVIACKDRSDPAPAPAKSDRANPAPAETTGGAVEGKEWSVANVTLVSGKQLVVNFRSIAPAGITPSELGWRVTVRCLVKK